MPAHFCQVVKNAAPDDATPDDHGAVVRFHYLHPSTHQRGSRGSSRTNALSLAVCSSETTPTFERQRCHTRCEALSLKRSCLHSALSQNAGEAHIQRSRTP